MDSSSEDEDGVTVSTNKVAIAIESSDSSSDDSPPPSSGEQQEAVQDEEKQAHAKKRRRSTSWTQDAAAAAAPAAAAAAGAEGTETGASHAEDDAKVLDEASTMKLAGTWYAANGTHRSSYRFVPVMAKRIPYQCTMASAGSDVSNNEDSVPTLFGIKYYMVAHSSSSSGGGNAAGVAGGKHPKESMREKLFEFEKPPVSGGNAAASDMNGGGWKATASHDPIAKVWFENHCKLLQKAGIHAPARPLRAAVGTLQSRLVASIDGGAGADHASSCRLLEELLKDIHSIAAVESGTLATFLGKNSSSTLLVSSSSIAVKEELIDKSARMPGMFLLLFHVDECVRRWATDRVGLLRTATKEGSLRECPELDQNIKRLAEWKAQALPKKHGDKIVSAAKVPASAGAASAAKDEIDACQRLLNNETIFTSDQAIFWEGMLAMLCCTAAGFLKSKGSKDVGAAVGQALQHQTKSMKESRGLNWMPMLTFVVVLWKRLRSSFWTWTGFASTEEDGRVVVEAALKYFDNLVHILAVNNASGGGAGNVKREEPGERNNSTSVHWIAPLVLSVLRCQSVSSKELKPLMTRVIECLTTQVPVPAALPIVIGFVDLQVDRLREALFDSEKLWGPFLIEQVLEEQQLIDDWYVSDTTRLVTGLIERDFQTRYACCERDNCILDQPKLVTHLWKALQTKIKTPETVNTIGLQIVLSACALGTDGHFVTEIKEAHVYSTITCVFQDWAMCMSTSPDVLPPADPFPAKGLLRLLCSQVETLWRFGWWFAEIHTDLTDETGTRAFFARILWHADEHSSLQALLLHGCSNLKILLNEGEGDNDEGRIQTFRFVTTVIEEYLQSKGAKANEAGLAKKDGKTKGGEEGVLRIPKTSKEATKALPREKKDYDLILSSEEEEISGSQRTRLRKGKGRSKLSPSSDSSSSEEGAKGEVHYIIDRLLEMKKDHEGIKWHVKWDGFPESEATWELESQLKVDLSLQMWSDIVGEYHTFKKQSRQMKLDKLKARESNRRDRRRMIEEHQADPDGSELVLSSSDSESNDDDDDDSVASARAKLQRPAIFVHNDSVPKKSPRRAAATEVARATARTFCKGSIGGGTAKGAVASKRSSHTTRPSVTGGKRAALSSSASASTLKRAKPDGPPSEDTRRPDAKKKRVMREVTAERGSSHSRSSAASRLKATRTPSPSLMAQEPPAIFNAHLRVAGGGGGTLRSASPFASDSEAGSRSSSPATVKATRTHFLRTVLGLQMSELERGPRELERTPTRFESQDEYREKFLKLMVEECRESICAEWRSSGKKTKPLKVRLVERKGKGPDFKITFQFILSARDVCDGDVLVVTFENSAGGTSSCLGLMLGSTSGGRLPEMQLCIPPAGQRSIDITNALKQERLSFTVQAASNIITFIRETDAMDRLETSPLMPFVLSGKKPVFPQLNSSTALFEEKRKEQLKILQKTLNPSQLQAIKFATEPNNPVSFIQGPPGTGKTKTLVSLLKVIFDQFPEKAAAAAAAGSGGGAAAGDGKRARPKTKSFSSIPEVARANTSRAASQKTVMLCAPSNAATDELVRRVTNPASGLALNVVRLGKGTSAHESVMPYVLEEQVQAELGELRRVCDELDAKISYTQEDMRRVDSELGGAQHRATAGGSHEQMAAYANMMGGTAGQELQREANQGRSKTESAEQKKKTLTKTLYERKKKFREAKKEYDRREKTCRVEILQRADVICCTLSSSGLGSIHEASMKVDTVIVDEAAQSTEPEILIPLQHGCRKLVLVGDPKQLSPTVLSSVADKAGLGRSLFERLHAAAKVLGCSIMLKQQYRMHPRICAFPSKQFYDSKLVAAAAVSERAPAPWSGHRELSEPYVFWDVYWGREERGGNMSLYNKAEVQACIHLYAELCRGAPSVNFGGRVAFITPYKKQKVLLEEKLVEAFGSQILSAVDVGTVDSFQGQERDVIIFSCVRAGGNSIGFLSDQKRMNVALTRAKFTLFVIGNAATLRYDPVWRELVQNAKTSGVLKPLPLDSLRVPNADRNKRSVPSNAFTSDKVVVPTLPAGRSGNKTTAVNQNSRRSRKSKLGLHRWERRMLAQSCEDRLLTGHKA
eukprot:gene2171-25400_t